MRIQDQLLFLKRFPQDEPGVDGPRFFTAYLDCLPPAAVCELVDTGFKRLAGECRALLRRLKRDTQIRVEACHERVFDEVLERLPHLLYQQQEQAYLFLFELMDVLPERHQRQVVELALDSPRTRQRSRAYGPLPKVGAMPFTERLLRNMAEFGDYGAAVVAVETWSATDLAAHRPLIEPLVERSPAFNRLYLRLLEVDPQALEPLRVTQPITYAVLLTRLGRTLTPEEAVAMYRANLNPSLSYLLVWCFGRMGLWDAVADAHELERTEQRNTALLAARYAPDRWWKELDQEADDVE